MIKDREKINNRIAFTRVKDNLNKLINNKHTFENIFNITFSKDKYTFFENITNTGSTKITYLEAKNEVIKYCNYFANKISDKDYYVGIYLDNSVNWIYTFYGLLMAGFSPILLSTRANDEEIKNIINKLDLKFIVSNKNFENTTCLKITEIDSSIIEDLKSKRKWANEIVFMTSGVSNEPKLASYTGEEITQQIACSLNIFKKNISFASSYKGYLKHLVILPFYHIFGLIAVFIWFSFFNVTFVIPNNLKPSTIRQACLISKVTHIFAVPLFWNTLAKQVIYEVKKADKEKTFNRFINLSIRIQKIFPKCGPKFVREKLFKKYLNKIFGTSIAFCISGGGSISKETLKIVNGLGYPLSNGYGATEIGITSLEISNKIDNRISQSVGYPFGSVAYVLDEKNNLHVKGKSIANKIMIKNKWIENKIVNTNDLVYKKDNGYYIHGRLDNLYVSKNGENYSLEALEDQIHLAFCDSYSLIINKSNELCLILSYSTDTLKSQIAKDINDLTLNNEISKTINKIYITSRRIPLANGIKIKRHQLIEEFNKYTSEFNLINTSDYKTENVQQAEIPQEVLDKVIEIFKKHFSENNIKNDSNFYLDLKGDSLSYFMLLSDIEKSFNCHLEISDKKIPLTPIDFSLLIKKVLNL